MSTPTPDLVEVQVPPEQVRPGDLLNDDERVDGDPVIEPAEVLVTVTPRRPEPYRLDRERLVTVRRQRAVVEPPPVTPAPAPAPDLTEQLAEVRDLALALADTAKAGSPAKLAADKVRNRIKGTSR
jgi:hypothetical protein